jgi:NAD(P)H-dependent flavin oxidoreductase YrpB (nitropropane dioxygenase family)
MKLADHLRELDAPARARLARKVSRAGSVGYLYLIAGGHRRPSAELAKKIEQATAGKVTRAELRPDIFERAA